MEKVIKPLNGYLVLFLSLVMLALSVYGFASIHKSAAYFWVGFPAFIATLLMWKGLMIVQPNDTKVLNLFGKYVGSVKANGMFFVNPFYATQKITLRAQNFHIPHIKVNDKMGNPIEIGAVIVWQVTDSYKAAYDVSDYINYVTTQSEAAVRNMAGGFSYDNLEDENATITLREGGEQVNLFLEKELSERLETAGVTIREARISHLAYAQEIAGAMLQRQQATAIVAARYKIVEGAVGMVEMALEELNKKEIVELDNEKKAAMVSNLLVVLCGEKSTQPIVNSGTLYQ